MSDTVPFTVKVEAVTAEAGAGVREDVADELPDEDVDIPSVMLTAYKRRIRGCR